MNWNKQLVNLEQSKNWKPAIELLQKTINNDTNNIDAYISMIYLLMNLLVEEDYNNSEHDYYAGLLKKYFLESYSKFSILPEYLFYTGIIAHMSEWYFDIDIAEAKTMLKKALHFEPENILYKWGYFTYLDMSNRDNKKQGIAYALEILTENSPVKEILKSKGTLGKYILEIMEHWSRIK